MNSYSPNLVEGDIPIKTQDLTEGMLLRSFSGLEDTVRLSKIVELTPSQYGGKFYSLEYDNGMKIPYTRGDSTHYLATGPAREPITYRDPKPPIKWVFDIPKTSW